MWLSNPAVRAILLLSEQKKYAQKKYRKKY